MMSWRRWGMRALALAMLLSLSAGPLMAGPRGGHNNGDEILDLVDGPGTDYFGDPDGGGIGKTRGFGDGDLRISWVMKRVALLIAAWNTAGVWSEPALTLICCDLGRTQAGGTHE